MISFLIGSAIGLTALQAGIDMPRKNFVACLKGAFETALTEHLATGDYGAFALKACDSQANSLRSGLIGFDVKNGVRRTQASADAAAQVTDYIAMSTEKYESRVGKSRVNVAAKTAPTTSVAVATPAAAPKP
ncbi:MAG: hypothetical protein ABIW16_06385 [Sphingomicrobium sp.]